MTRGAYISGIGHGGILFWALFGGIFVNSRDPLPVQAADVSLISSQEFAALMAPDTAPETPDASLQPMFPIVDDVLPEVNPSAETAPKPVDPVAVEVPQPDTAPAPLSPPEEPTTEVSEQPPVTPTPPAAETAPEIANTDAQPTPAPAPRVAPEAAPAPAPESEIAPDVSPEVVTDENADTVAEETPATAPEEAATEIVTEAETPSPALSSSPLPVVRPSSLSQPPSTVADAVADAVAEAVASDTPAPSRPTGPPLSGSEKEGFRVAVGKCWNVDTGSAAARVTVTVGFGLDRSGKITAGSLKFLSASEGDSQAVNAAFEAARRAIIRCGTKGYDLPLEKYSQWQDIEMTFNPEGMRIK